MEPQKRIRKIFQLLLSLPDWCSSARSCCAEIENRHSRGMVVWEDMSESRAASNEDEDSREERSSDEETETDQGGYESGSGSDEGGSDSDDPSSGTGSGSGEEEDSSADSNVVSDEKESGEDDEGKKAAKKREDFEKMKEISAHMDNIIQRFENLFRCHESGEETTALPKLPPLPQPEPVKDSRHRSVSARPMTVDQAVSAWRLTTDRAVSVASGLHFDDELSVGSGRSNTKPEDNTEHHRRGRRRTATHRRRSGDREGGRNGASKRTGTQKREPETNAAHRGSVGTESSSERDTTRSENADKSDLRTQPGSRKAGEGRRGPRDNRGPGFGPYGWHERLLWDELRDSLAGVAGSEPVTRRNWSRDGGRDVVEQATGDRASKEQQRRLIDEAIAVLLEGSSSDEGAMATNYS